MVSVAGGNQSQRAMVRIVVELTIVLVGIALVVCAIPPTTRGSTVTFFRRFS